jgi:transposase
MFTDEHRVTVWNEIRQHDLWAFSRFLQPEVIREAATRTGNALGRGPLHLGNLLWLAVASALHTTKSFADILVLTLKLLSDAEGFATTPLATEQKKSRRRRKSRIRSKHDPRRLDATAVSEEAFVKARRRAPREFWLTLLVILAERFQAQHGQFVRWKGFRLLALDGTTIPLDRWQSLTEHFGTSSNGKGKRRTTQARMLLLQFPLARIPYCYELCPYKTAEKTAAVGLLSRLQDEDLVLLDRGFWSYGLFWQRQRQKAFFGIRLLKTAGLKHVRRLGPKDRLVEYAPIDRKWRKEGLPRSIALRRIDYQIRGFRPSAVVTNVLDPAVTSREDWVRLSTESEPGRCLDPGLYHRRWEIETSFSELKVVQGMTDNLRSRTPEGIAFEIAGHVLFYLLVRWMMVEAAVKHGCEPLRLSFTYALRELHDLSEKLITSSPFRVRRVLLPRLLARVASHLVPLRPGRHYPRPNDTKPKNKGKGRIRLPHKLPKQLVKRKNTRTGRHSKG